MKQLLLLIPFIFFLGCETPQEKNKKEIQKLQTEIQKLKLISNKIEDINIQLKQLKNRDSKQDIDKLKDLKEKIVLLQNQLNNLENKESPVNFDYIVIKPTTLITIKKEVNIYNKPEINSTILTKWEQGISFTSYKEKNQFIKVTGYFIDGKWTPNKDDWWIQKSDVTIKIVDKK